LRRAAESRPPWRASTKRLNELDRKANDCLNLPILTVATLRRALRVLAMGNGFSEKTGFNGKTSTQTAPTGRVEQIAYLTYRLKRRRALVLF
jgi:hypothetical protein